MPGPLEGLRVIDLTDDSGRFASKLLTELGADVVRMTALGSRGQPMVDPGLDASGGVLDWWYDGGKRSHPVDLDSEAGLESYRQMASSADLIVDSLPPGRLARLGIDHDAIAKQNPRLVQVSISAFGQTGPRASWVTSDLVSAAMGGFLSVTGLPDRPLNVWGRQAYNYAGFLAAICALAGVMAARRDGKGAKVDVSIHECLAGSIENPVMQWVFDDLLPIPKIAARQAALHWLRVYDLARCKTGYTMITPTPGMMDLMQWLAEDGAIDIAEWQDLEPEDMVGLFDRIMDVIRVWVRQYDASELWWEAQQRHIAFGAVYDIDEVADIPQFKFRDFFKAVEGTNERVKLPGHMVRFSGTPLAAPRPPADSHTPLDELVSEWRQRQAPAADAASSKRPLEGLRVADFTWVLAGPFCTRMLGDLGADILRIQTEERATSVNDPTHPYYFVWSRSKRSVSIDMKHPQALASIRKLLQNCDVLIENYSAGVLDSWGLDWDTVHEWNPRLVYVTMSGCGQDGPWKDVISYAPTIHALCGITKLTNFSDRGDVGAGFSLNDHLAGYAAAVSLLAALAARDRTGMGQKIDMAQLEVGTYVVGPALLDFLSNGRKAEPLGNVDGLQDHVPNNVYRCADGEFLAVSVTADAQWPALVEAIGNDELKAAKLASESARRQSRVLIDAIVSEWVAQQTADGAMLLLQGKGIAAGKVQHAGNLIEEDPQLAARRFWQAVDHPVFGKRITDTFPATWDDQRLAVDRLSPAFLGEHNFDVWTELGGLDADQVADAMANGLLS